MLVANVEPGRPRESRDQRGEVRAPLHSEQRDELGKLRVEWAPGPE